MDIVEAVSVTNANKRGKCKIMVVVLFAMGVACVVTSLFCEKIFEDMVKKKLVLSKGNEAYNKWQAVPIPVYMTYHIFNYTNVDDIVNKYAKPKVSQLGPFVYREIRINEVTDYNEYNITYLQNYSYVFEPTMSCSKCKENVEVYAPNIAFITIIDILLRKFENHPILKLMFKLAVDGFFRAIPGASLFKKLPVSKLLWGYEDRLLHILRDMEKIFSDFGITFTPIEAQIQFQYNGTANANYIGNTTILTGKENINDVQKIVNWRGLDYAPYWNSKYAEMLNGSDGSHARPFLSTKDEVFTFVPQICRSVGLNYEKDVAAQDISLYRYSAKLFPLSPEFCNDSKTCVDGLLPLSRCAGGLGPPMYISAAHFYQADPKLVTEIDGIKPDADLHKMYTDIEPITGVTLSAHKRIQLNVMGRKDEFIAKSLSFRNEVNYLPILMLDEWFIIDKVNADQFKEEVLLPKRIVVYGSFTLLVVGILLIVAALVFTVRLWRQSRGDDNTSINWRQMFYKTTGIHLSKSTPIGVENPVALKEIVMKGKTDLCNGCVSSAYDRSVSSVYDRSVSSDTILAADGTVYDRSVSSDMILPADGKC